MCNMIFMKIANSGQYLIKESKCDTNRETVLGINVKEQTAIPTVFQQYIYNIINLESLPESNYVLVIKRLM